MGQTLTATATSGEGEARQVSPGSHMPSTPFSDADTIRPAARSYDKSVRGTSDTSNKSFPSSSKIVAAHDPITFEPVPFEYIKPDTVVTVDGIGQMAFESARVNGWAGPVGGGDQSSPFDLPSDNQAESPGGEEGDQDEHPELQSERMESEDAEASMDALASGVDLGTSMEALAELADGNAEVSERVLADAASQAGVEPQDISRHIETARAGFTQQAEAKIRSVIGSAFEAGAFWDWAWNASEATELMQKSISDQVTKGTTHAYGDLATEYVANLDRINPEAILSADFGEGLGAIQDEKGEVLITKDGRPIGSWETLYRTGFVNLGEAAL